MKRTFTLLLGCLSLVALPVHAADVRLWRMECGKWPTLPLVDSCYLIQHDTQWMIWDTGMGAELLGHPALRNNRTPIALDKTIAQDLEQLKLIPDQIGIVALSHRHYDHIGQAAAFPRATLMMGRKDYDAMAADPGIDRARLTPWMEGGGHKNLLDADYDVFGDGSVVMLSMPGHTLGSFALLVRLKKTGPLLLSGDLYHSTQSRQTREIGAHEEDPQAMRASFVRFETLADQLHAKVIIPHEPQDVAKLPLFPAAAE